MSRKYHENKNIDMTAGRCCFCYENGKGARCIQIVDIFFIFNLPRWFFAIWSKVDNDRWPIYARMRLVSFYLFWLAVVGYFVSQAVERIFATEENDTDLLISALIFLACLLVVILFDFHFSRVVKYHALGHSHRVEQEKKAKKKAKRYQKRLEKANRKVHYGGDMEAAENANPVVMPEKESPDSKR